MDWFACVILLCSGVWPLCSFLSCEYRFEDEEKTWPEAQEYCRENYADLATIESEEDMDRLARTVGIENTRKVWIGLYNSWQWSLTDNSVNREGGTEYRNWHCGKTNNKTNNKPNNKDNNKDNNKANNKKWDGDCTFMKGGKWHVEKCSKKKFFICYSASSKGYTPVTEKEKTWKAAQSYCREHHTDLVSVRNQDENEKIKNLLESKEYWIGLYRGSWRWSDQTNLSFTKWPPGRPHNSGRKVDCGLIMFKNNKRTWDVSEYSEKHSFLCYDDKLILVDEKKTWSEALNYCREKHMDLVSVNSRRLQHWVAQRAKRASTPFVWLGLRYIYTLKFWFWVSGDTACYPNWAPGNGTGTRGLTGAVERDGDQQWVGRPETEELNFICSKYEDDYEDD